MNCAGLIVALLLTLAPHEQKFPAEFYQIPEPLRAQATIIFTGTYGRGRGPCILRSDGSRVWALEYWFHVTKTYRGKVGGKAVYINNGMLPETEYVSAKLEVGHDYLVLLRPGEESLKVIREGKHASVWEALHGEEIIAVIELK